MRETTAGENIKFLDSDVPDISADAAARVVRELYGIEGALSRLYSERDQNFRAGARPWNRHFLDDILNRVHRRRRRQGAHRPPAELHARH